MRIDKEQIVAWCEHPVTLLMLEYLKHDKTVLEENLKSYMMNCEKCSDMEVGKLRGHIHAANAFLNIKDTMLIAAQEELEDEISRIGTQSSS